MGNPNDANKNSQSRKGVVLKNQSQGPMKGNLEHSVMESAQGK